MSFKRGLRPLPIFLPCGRYLNLGHYLNIQFCVLFLLIKQSVHHKCVGSTSQHVFNCLRDAAFVRPLLPEGQNERASQIFLAKMFKFGRCGV